MSHCMTTLVHKTLRHLDTSAAVKVRPDRKKKDFVCSANRL